MLSVIRGLTFPHSTSAAPSRHFVPQAGQTLLITDSPASSAQFLVHALLQSQLKREGATDARACVLVSVDHDFAHTSAIAARSNLNLHQCLRDRSLVYVDALSQASQPPDNLADDTSALGGHSVAPVSGILICPPLAMSLRPLFDVIQRAFEHASPTATGRLLILGDVSTLEWIGIPSTEVTRFVRAVRALAAKHKSGVVIVYHSPSADLPIESDVLRHLVLSCDVHAEVRELSSGLSSAVSGQVALHPGFTAPDPQFVPIPRERALQYRLSDGGVVWFERGTSAGVL